MAAIRESASQLPRRLSTLETSTEGIVVLDDTHCQSLQCLNRSWRTRSSSSPLPCDCPRRGSFGRRRGTWRSSPFFCTAASSYFPYGTNNLTDSSLPLASIFTSLLLLLLRECTANYRDRIEAFLSLSLPPPPTNSLLLFRS